VMLPQLPFAGPIAGVGDGEGGLGGADANQDLDPQLVQAGAGLVGVDDIGAVLLRDAVIVGEVGPVDVAGVERISPQRRLAAQKSRLVCHSITPAGNIIARLDEASGEEDARAADTGIMPPVPRAAAGTKLHA